VESSRLEFGGRGLETLKENNFAGFPLFGSHINNTFESQYSTQRISIIPFRERCCHCVVSRPQMAIFYLFETMKLSVFILSAVGYGISVTRYDRKSPFDYTSKAYNFNIGEEPKKE
jgi:hypothetical protein